ncbi:DUF2017 family protein [Lysobacter korlensis]|uniref:DUF2017 family protein n=1 Tax=Lysobacter korlensis TaxID=553636 RepID=A0ABV6RN68_9GAMM
MRPFAPGPDGTILLHLTAEECRLLRDLARQLPVVLTGAEADPAVDRLLPTAYPDDADAAAEFRAFTRSGLVERKLTNAGRVAATLPDESGTTELTPEDAQAWLRTLTDLRLVLATRLGIEEDGDDGAPDELLRAVYDWLAYLQDCLLAVLEGTP